MKKVLIVVGTRPNFIKITRFYKEFEAYSSSMSLYLAHTGQHFDYNMADVFFQQLKIPRPDFFLNASEGSAVTKVANILLGLEKVLHQLLPDLVVVVGDVDSTLAAAYTAHKSGFKVAHLESGLRSFDRDMPEEINRVLTDAIADYFFVTEKSGTHNLLAEKKSPGNIFFVGNTMIDSLVAFSDEILQSEILDKLNLNEKPFALVTMHRPSNVDFAEGLQLIIQILQMIEKLGLHSVLPLHPRTSKNLQKFGLDKELRKVSNCIICPPMDYFSFQKLIINAKFVLTDSGGIQEETTYYRVPCLTLRKNTERPSTLEVGTNVLLPFDLEAIKRVIEDILAGKFKKGAIPVLWDGNATHRIVKVIHQILCPTPEKIL